MTNQQLTHIDIGDSPAIAAVQATEPYTEFLCGADTTTGDSCIEGSGEIWPKNSHSL